MRDRQTEVSTKQPLTFTLRRPAKLSTVEGALRIEPVLEGHMTASADRRHFTWAPTGEWADLTTYQVRLNSFKDANGIAVRGQHWSFTTTIVPKVVALLSDSGVAIADASEIPLNSNLKLVFNSSMDPASVLGMINAKPATFEWSNDSKEASLSTKGIAAGDLAISVDRGRDRLGHDLAEGWKVTVKLVFVVSGHTTPLRLPAIVQIPNDNYGARDQSGIQFADMVFEYLTEASITRLSAVFSNVPDVVGPIRSGRLISFKITRHYRGINYFSGLSSGSFAALFGQEGVPTLFDTQGYYYRSGDRFPPNNLYIKGEAINRYQSTLPALGDFKLSTGTAPALAGVEAINVSVPEHNSTYAYNVATGTYSKTEDGHLMSDALISQPLRIALLVVLHARETMTSYVEDVGGAHGRDFDLDGGGQAEYYAGGQKRSGRWSVPDRNSPIAFQLDDGRALTLPHSLVWIDVMAP